MSGGRRVLLTGASGFIGRHAQGPLLDLGYEVHAVSRRADQEWALPGVFVHRADLLSAEDRRGLVAEVNPERLLHLAWYVVPGRFWEDPQNLHWVGASLDLAAAFVAQGGERAVFAGTCAEYDWSFPLCEEASTPLRPATLYGVSKLALFSILTKAFKNAGRSMAWGRIFFLFGPHEPAERLIPSVILALQRGEPALCTHGRQVRDFLHVSDVGAAFAALLHSEASGAVNIASGEARRIAEVVSLIAAEMGHPELIRLGARPTPANEVEELRADVTRLREEVGFSPRYSMKEGLRATVAWWAKEQPVACAADGEERQPGPKGQPGRRWSGAPR